MLKGGGDDPLVLGGSLCSEYLALQPQEQEDCETVMEEKCSTQNTTHCITQYVKVTTLTLSQACSIFQFVWRFSLFGLRENWKMLKIILGKIWEILQPCHESSQLPACYQRNCRTRSQKVCREEAGKCVRSPGKCGEKTTRRCREEWTPADRAGQVEVLREGLL